MIEHTLTSMSNSILFYREDFKLRKLFFWIYFRKNRFFVRFKLPNNESGIGIGNGN